MLIWNCYTSHFQKASSNHQGQSILVLDLGKFDEPCALLEETSIVGTNRGAKRGAKHVRSVYAISVGGLPPKKSVKCYKIEIIIVGIGNV